MMVNVGAIRSHVYRIGVVILLKPALDNADTQKRFFVVWTNERPSSPRKLALLLCVETETP